MIPFLETGANLANTAYQIYRDKRTLRREDSAYQRASQDMQKAGLNPLLHNVSPAGSSPGPQDIGVSSAVQQRALNAQIALQKAQALSSVATTARELSTTFQDYGINLGPLSFGRKDNSRTPEGMVSALNQMLAGVGLKKIKFQPNSAKTEEVQSVLPNNRFVRGLRRFHKSLKGALD